MAQVLPSKLQLVRKMKLLAKVTREVIFTARLNCIFSEKNDGLVHEFKQTKMFGEATDLGGSKVVSSQHWTASSDMLDCF